MTDPPKIRLRDAGDEDLEFAWSLYRTLMKPLTVALMDWDEPNQMNIVKEALHAAGTSVITIEEIAVGWLQVRETAGDIYLAQLYIQTESQNQGIGTVIVRQLCDRARRQGKRFTLDIMINNAARSLYERLGFRAVGKSKYKIKMQWFDAE